MTGPEMKDIRFAIGEAIGRRLSLSDMAKLVGLKDYGLKPNGKHGNGQETYRRWEEGDGPSGPVAVLLELMARGVMGYDRYHDGEYFMREEIRRRLDDD
jgi:hypothetical protein